MNRTARLSILVAFFSLFLERHSHAYVDPGTGSMLLQLLLGGVAGLAIALKLFGHRILAFFRMGKRHEGGKPDTSASSSASPDASAGETSLTGDQERL